MHLAVFGATGGTGRAVVEQALAAGHTVTAFVRRPAAVTHRHERLDVVRGDVLEPGAVKAAISGTDAVVSALGIGYRRASTTVYSAGTAHIIEAMRDLGVQRLVCVSTASLELPPKTSLLQWLVFRCALHPMLRRPYADMVVMEKAVRDSGRDWTLVRAARLTNGRRSGRYRTAVNGKLRGGWSISRSDLAHYIVNHLHGGPIRATVEVAY